MSIANRWSTGPSKKPWIWAVCRSTVRMRLAPAVLYRSATSRAEDLADLLGQLRKSPAGEEHQALLGLANDAAHRLGTPLFESACYSLAVSPGGWDSALPRARAAASAAADPGRRCSTQRSKMRCVPSVMRSPP